AQVNIEAADLGAGGDFDGDGGGWFQTGRVIGGDAVDGRAEVVAVGGEVADHEAAVVLGLDGGEFLEAPLAAGVGGAEGGDLDVRDGVAVLVDDFAEEEGLR